jgi:hypothetical protein
MGGGGYPRFRGRGLVVVIKTTTAIENEQTRSFFMAVDHGEWGVGEQPPPSKTSTYTSFSMVVMGDVAGEQPPPSKMSVFARFRGGWTDRLVFFTKQKNKKQKSESTSYARECFALLSSSCQNRRARRFTTTML